MAGRPSISAVIITLNEEKRLPYALRSVVPWVDEVVVVDMHSDDGTTDVARDMGAKVYYHDRIDFFDAARDLGLEKSSGDWLLLLDADELIPPPLSNSLIQLANSGAFDVVKVPRLNYLHGVSFKHTGWGPEQDRQTRFFRRGHVRVVETLHVGMVIQKGARIATPHYRPGHAILHFCWTDFTHSIDKLNRYSTLEAKQASMRGQSPSTWGAGGRASKEFFNRFVRAKGYRDGWRGFYMSCFAALYSIASDAKLTELSEGGSEWAQREHQQIAEQWLSAYPKDDGSGLPREELGAIGNDVSLGND